MEGVGRYISWKSNRDLCTVLFVEWCYFHEMKRNLDFRIVFMLVNPLIFVEKGMNPKLSYKLEYLNWLVLQILVASIVLKSLNFEIFK